MKKMMTGLSMTMVALVLIISCQKEKFQEVNASSVAKKNLATTVSPSKVPFISLTVTADSFCGATTPCGTTLYSLLRNNMLSVTNNSQTWFPSLTYTFYKSNGASPIETFTPISGAQYTCGAYTSNFASGYLDNATRILIFANDPASAGPSMSTNLLYDQTIPGITNYPALTAPSTYKIATTGSFKGQSCSGSSEK